tara:strand:+ start:2479 stop:2583 length:105 start_codon:yes stop_codon:yes gene_type:complete
MKFIIPVCVVILLVYLLIKRQEDKKNETFEDRDY